MHKLSVCLTDTRSTIWAEKFYLFIVIKLGFSSFMRIQCLCMASKQKRWHANNCDERKRQNDYNHSPAVKVLQIEDDNFKYDIQIMVKTSSSPRRHFIRRIIWHENGRIHPLYSNISMLPLPKQHCLYELMNISWK